MNTLGYKYIAKDIDPIGPGDWYLMYTSSLDSSKCSSTFFSCSEAHKVNSIRLSEDWISSVALPTEYLLGNTT